MERYTIRDFEKEFPTDAACLEWLRAYLYPNGIWCKQCRTVTKHHRVTKRRSYSCDRCGHHVHPTADTIYHKSPTPLKLWFYAIYLMASTRCGISAKQLERELGVTYKTAWRMFHQIRSMLNEEGHPLSGKVEVDDTYIGATKPGKRGRGAAGKTIVLGMVERKGRVVARIVPNMSRQSVLPVIQSKVTPHKTTVFTDELQTYSLLSTRYAHAQIQHNLKIYVRGDVHTNTIEGFWSQIKHGLRGIYRAVKPAHLQAYVNEYAFRYNHRNDVKPMFKAFLGQIAVISG